MDSVQSALDAEARGANRLELCGNLHLDGTTPDGDLIRAVLDHVHIPVKVMVRSRGGDFVYNDHEFAEMLDSVKRCKALGVPEIVTGILLGDHTLDIDRISTIADIAYPIPVTIHKCIDLVPDVFEAIEQLKDIPGVTSILSSGQAETAELGADLLAQMRTACGERLTLIVAGKVTPENLPILYERIGATEYHGRRIV